MSKIWDFNRYADGVAAIDDEGKILRYSELKEISEQLGKVAKRKLVFHIATNTLGSLAGYAGLIDSECVPAMISHDMDEGLFGKLFNEYKPEFVWADGTRATSIKGLVKVEGVECYEYSLYQTEFAGNLDSNDLNDSVLYPDLALLLTTSGSTGSPKFVRQSYANILANTESIVEYLKLDKDERPITTLPMNYTYGLSIINSHLYVGATILVTEKTLMQKEFWNFFKTEKATSFGGVPYTYEILKKLRIFRMDIPSLKTMTQAGGKLTKELHEEFAEYAAKTGRNFVVMYGQTEATARMAYLPADKSVEKAGSMGIAIPGGSFKLIDTEGRIITDADVVGELVYEGKNVTLGYAETRIDLSKGDERNGILETGDMAKMDEDGYFYIVGRKKRFLKIYGKRVNLDEVDRLIKSKFDYVDCASTGRDDHLVIFVNDETIMEDVKSFISDTTKINLPAISVKYIEEIPKNDAGKTLYIALEKYL